MCSSLRAPLSSSSSSSASNVRCPAEEIKSRRKTSTACRSSVAAGRKTKAVATMRLRCLWTAKSFGLGATTRPKPLRRKTARRKPLPFSTTAATLASLEESTVRIASPKPLAATAAVALQSLSASSRSTSSTSVAALLPMPGRRGTAMSTGIAHQSMRASEWLSAFTWAGCIVGLPPLPLCCQKLSFRVPESMVSTRGSLMPRSAGTTRGANSLALASATTAKQPQGSRPPGSNFLTASVCCAAQSPKAMPVVSLAESRSNGTLSPGTSLSPGCGGVAAA
mmetsp:Transcript_92378/g.197980  ORF Transcript_92378/g.197980 Transcript_92378/m.197980 type:complete len:280 (+) Transcript_92378:413-1252(+)